MWKKKMCMHTAAVRCWQLSKKRLCFGWIMGMGGGGGGTLQGGESKVSRKLKWQCSSVFKMESRELPPCSTEAMVGRPEDRQRELRPDKVHCRAVDGLLHLSATARRAANRLTKYICPSLWTVYFPHVTWWFLWHWPISDVRFKGRNTSYGARAGLGKRSTARLKAGHGQSVPRPARKRIRKESGVNSQFARFHTLEIGSRPSSSSYRSMPAQEIVPCSAFFLEREIAFPVYDFLLQGFEGQSSTWSEYQTPLAKQQRNGFESPNSISRRSKSNAISERSPRRTFLVFSARWVLKEISKRRPTCEVDMGGVCSWAGCSVFDKCWQCLRQM